MATKKTNAEGPAAQPREEAARVTEPTTSNTPPQETPQPAAKTSSPNSFRQKWEEKWLRRLRTLPQPVFDECVRRLQKGASARSVAGWMQTQANLGGLQGRSTRLNSSHMSISYAV